MKEKIKALCKKYSFTTVYFDTENCRVVAAWNGTHIKDFKISDFDEKELEAFLQEYAKPKVPHRPDLQDEDWEGTYKGQLFEQLHGRKCDYSRADCYKMSLIQKQINIMVQDLLKGNPEAAKALLELAGCGSMYLKTQDNSTQRISYLAENYTSGELQAAAHAKADEEDGI